MQCFPFFQLKMQEVLPQPLKAVKAYLDSNVQEAAQEGDKSFPLHSVFLCLFCCIYGSHDRLSLCLPIGCCSWNCEEEAPNNQETLLKVYSRCHLGSYTEEKNGEVRSSRCYSWGCSAVCFILYLEFHIGVFRLCLDLEFMGICENKIKPSTNLINVSLTFYFCLHVSP